MKREIICIPCSEKWKPKDYEGEWHHRETGKARGFKNGPFTCDQCNATIPKGTECVAQSFGLDRDPYEPWEDKYLGEEEGVVDGSMIVHTDEGVTIIPPK